MALVTITSASAAAWFGGCSSSSGGNSETDGGTDGSVLTDSAPGKPDGTADTGAHDSAVGSPEAAADTGTHDTGVLDTGVSDARSDTGVSDTGAKDTGVSDTGVGEASTEGGADAGDAGALSAQATAGLAASPFPITTTGMTTAELEAVGRGSYMVNVVSACGDCHNNPEEVFPAGFLAGGSSFGPVDARNLTSDPNHGLRMTQAQFVQTIQTGMDWKLSPTDGGAAVALIVMPWEDFRWMAVADLEAIYAYLLLVPADTNAVPLGPPGGPIIPMPVTFTDGVAGDAGTGPTLPSEANDAPLFSARGDAIEPLGQPSGYASLSAADQAAYGRGSYLATAAAACGDCHTNPERTSTTSTVFNTAEWLTGGRVFPATPPLNSVVGVDRSMSANLLGAVNGFIPSGLVNETVFTTTLQKHVHGDEPDMAPLAWPMPTGFEKMVASDYHALWVFLSTQTPITGAADKATQDAALYCFTSDAGAEAGPDAAASVACPTLSTCDSTHTECVPTSPPCTVAADCFVCDTCSDAGACTEPAPAADGGTNACIANGI